MKLGECYLEMKRYDEARRNLEEALALRRDLANAHYDLALVAEARGDAREAAAQYQGELARDAKAYRASFNLAKLLLQSGRRDEALGRLREAVASSPEFGTGHLYLAKALLDAGDLAGAEAAARRGLGASPDEAVAPLGHYVLADVYARRGRSRESAREVATAKKLARGGQ